METEMKSQVKKEWKTPELIVLVRNKPEEAVLAACKNSTANGAYNVAGNTCATISPFCAEASGS
jgi:hypothetical protein